MALTKVSPSLFQVSNNITSVTVGGSTQIPSLTFDSNGVITAASNNALNLNSVTGDFSVSGNTTIAGNLNLDSAGTTGIRVPSANTIAFHTAGTEDVRIDANGNMGIGTSTPTVLRERSLEVSSSGTNDGAAIIANKRGNGIATMRLATVGAATGFDINFNFPNTGDLAFYDLAAATGRMIIDSSGNFAFNSGYGSAAIAYGCRAWVNFNGTGTVAIRASGNVTSITDNGTGDYTVNFTTAMPDANYSVSGSSDTGETSRVFSRHSSSPTTSAVRVVCVYPGNALFDNGQMHVAIFR